MNSSANVMELVRQHSLPSRAEGWLKVQAEDHRAKVILEEARVKLGWPTLWSLCNKYYVHFRNIAWWAKAIKWTALFARRFNISYLLKTVRDIKLGLFKPSAERLDEYNSSVSGYLENVKPRFQSRCNRVNRLVWWRSLPTWDECEDDPDPDPGEDGDHYLDRMKALHEQKASPSKGFVELDKFLS